MGFLRRMTSKAEETLNWKFLAVTKSRTLEKFGNFISTITLHLVRHAQGFHNLCEANHTLPDPSLTPLGEQQCRDLRANFPYHSQITHLISSPLRRTIYTTLLSFTPEVEKGLKIVALPEIQETSDLPCDTGSDPEKLKEEFEGKVDLSLVHEGWNSKKGKWAAEAGAVERRAKEARIWIRDYGLKAMRDGLQEVHIVAVTHGGFLHYFTEDWSESSKFTGTGWANTEFRSYEFKSEDDENASLVETKTSWERRKGNEKQMSEAEQRNLKLLAQQKWNDDGFVSNLEQKL